MRAPIAADACAFFWRLLALFLESLLGTYNSIASQCNWVTNIELLCTFLHSSCFGFTLAETQVALWASEVRRFLLRFPLPYCNTQCAIITS